MVSTSARNAGGPWFDSRSRHDRFLYANSVCLYILLSYDVAVFQWITSCHKNRMTTRVITLLRE